jgi:hypothetical protein
VSSLRFWLAIVCKVCMLPETNLLKTTLLLHIKSVLESKLGLEISYPAWCFLLFLYFIPSIQFIIWSHSTTCHIIPTLNSMLHNKQYLCHSTYCISYWNRFSLQVGHTPASILAFISVVQLNLPSWQSSLDRSNGICRIIHS